MAAPTGVARAEKTDVRSYARIGEASSNYLEVQELYEKRSELTEQIADLYVKWEELEHELENA
jgi:ketopantoate reductase